MAVTPGRPAPPAERDHRRKGSAAGEPMTRPRRRWARPRSPR